MNGLTIEGKILKMITILIGILLFSLLGNLIPQWTHQSADVDNYFEMGIYRPHDLNTGDEYIFIDYSRFVAGDFEGSWNGKIIRLTDNGVEEHVFSDGRDTTFSHSSFKEMAVIKYPTPTGLEEGIYFWRTTYVMEVYPDIFKSITVESERFRVYEGVI